MPMSAPTAANAPAPLRPAPAHPQPQTLSANAPVVPLAPALPPPETKGEEGH